MTTPDDPTAATPVRTNPMSTGKAVALTLAVLLAIAGGIFAIWYFSDSQQAIRACKAYISDQVLVSPASAEYSGEQFFDTDDPEVAGNVDSQNSYGAMIRSRFACHLQKVGGDWTVTTGYVI